jgi:hypothetical protein
MQIHHAAHCPAVLYGLALPTPPAGAMLDRARLQELIDLLDRFDFASDSADIGRLPAALRAFGAELA